MEAIHLTKYGKPEEGLRLVEIAEPGDHKSGQILIRVEYAPINDSDLLVASGLYADHPKLPSVVGNEGAGKVLAVGDGVLNVEVGDRVVIPHGVFSWAEKVLETEFSAKPRLIPNWGQAMPGPFEGVRVIQKKRWAERRKKRS